MDSSSFSGSSKTTESSTSKLSSFKDKEVDFSKDNSASPIDLECGIQSARIEKILDLALYKTKLALCLPLLMREKRTLTSILKPQDYEELSFIFEQYNSLLFSSSLMNMDAVDDIESGDCTLKQRINPELGHLICILNSYKNLKPKIEAMVEKIRADADDPDYRKRRSVPQGFAYLLELERFRDLVIIQTRTTAAEEWQAAFDTRKLENSNVALMVCAEEYSKSLREEYEHFKEAVMHKNNTIEKLKRELAGLQQSANVILNKKILDSERKMVLLSRTHVAKSEVLKEVEIESRETYDRVLAKDIYDERNHRLRRRKVETQLLSWIQKYDLDMKVKQSELDEVTDEFDDETRQVENLERKLEEQDKEFVPLMEEKDAEYHAEMTQKMNLFIIEHAARVIQMAWKETVANRAEKAKLKKIQRQQRAAAEAAAKAAAEEAKREAAAAKKAAKEAKLQAAAEKKAAKEAEKKDKEAAKAAKAEKPVETEEEDD